MSDNLEGEVSYKSLIKNHIKGATSVFDSISEAFCNAIEATKIKMTEEKEANYKPDISISFYFKSISKEEKKLKFLDFVSIEDNGVGFNDVEYARFKKLYDDTKGFNNKGSGRYRMLKFFRNIKYYSIYKKDDSFYERVFDFSESYINTRLINEISNKEIDKNLTGTKVLLDSLKRKNESGSLSIDFLSIEQIKKNFIKKHILEFCTNKNIKVSFIEYVNNKKTNTSIVKEIDIPKIDKTYSISIPYYKIENNEVVELENKEKFQIDIFKIDSSKLSENQTYFVSKNILSEKSDIQFPLLGRTATFDNSHYLLITSGKYLDNSENSDDSRNFMFLSKLEYEKKAKKDSQIPSFDFLDDSFLIKDSFEDEYKKAIVKAYPQIKEKQKEENLKIEKLKETFLIEDDDLKDISVQLGSTEEEILKQIYEQDAKKLAMLDAKIMENINKLDTLDSSSQNFESNFESVVSDLTRAIPLANRNYVSKYVARRKLVLEYFSKLLKGSLPIDIKEKHFHHLLLKQGTENNENSNLWIVNEEFIYFNGVSNKQFSKIELDGKKVFKSDFDVEEEKFLNSYGEIKMKRKPDVLLFPSENKCIILEFKDKSVNPSMYLNQISQYATLIYNYTSEDFFFNSFYGYLVCESFTPEEIRMTDSDFIESFNFDYMLRPKKPIAGISTKTNKRDAALYMEVIKYSTLIKRAYNRNKIFIKKLGLDKIAKI